MPPAIPEDFLLPNAPTTYAYYIFRDGTPLPRSLCAGNFAVVILESDKKTILKVTALRMNVDNGSKTESKYNKYTPDLDRERAVYQRLQCVTGIARYLGPVGEGFRLEYYPRGSLAQYVEDKAEVSMHQKRKWIIEMVGLVARCHEARVLIYDVALRNFVLDKDDNLHLIDFADSTLLPFETNMDLVNDHGITARLDLLHLGASIYSLSTWSYHDVDCLLDDENWPELSSLPSTSGVFCGSIIRSCWQGRYKSARELYWELLHPKARRKIHTKATK